MRNGRLVPDRPTVTAQKRRHIGMVFQRFNLFAHLTALDNVAIGPRRVLGMKLADGARTCGRTTGTGETVGPRVEAAGATVRRSAATRGDRARHGDAAGAHAVR